MRPSEIILSTGEVKADLDWVPLHVSRFLGSVATMDENTKLVPPESIIRHDNTTLFACSGVQVIYPQLFEGVGVPEHTQFISQPVIRTQHLDNVEEGTSTSFVNYNLIRFGRSETDHIVQTKRFFDFMKEADVSGVNEFRHVHTKDSPQNWNGLPVMMNTNEKLWINGVELGESIFYADMQLPSGDTVSVSELAFGLERLVFATNPGGSYYSRVMGGLDTEPVLKDSATARVSDAIKSVALMAMHGVLPSSKGQGYRLRKFVARAVAENEHTRIDTQQIVANAFNYWSSFMEPLESLDHVSDIISAETDRAYNRRTLNYILSEYGISINMDVNQRQSSFQRQLIATGRLTKSMISEIV